jgi:replicative DNA helicase
MALIQEHVTCNNVSIVVIDHLGEIASEKDEYAMDHWMKLQKYVKELKNVTTRLGVRLIVIAQQNREGYNNGRGQAGGLGRVAGTLELSRICDCFINMYHTRDGDKIIALEKNRNGEMCKFKIDFDGARQIITIEEEILE